MSLFNSILGVADSSDPNAADAVLGKTTDVLANAGADWLKSYVNNSSNNSANGTVIGTVAMAKPSGLPPPPTSSAAPVAAPSTQTLVNVKPNYTKFIWIGLGVIAVGFLGYKALKK